MPQEKRGVCLRRKFNIEIWIRSAAIEGVSIMGPVSRKKEDLVNSKRPNLWKCGKGLFPVSRGGKEIRVQPGISFSSLRSTSWLLCEIEPRAKGGSL